MYIIKGEPRMIVGSSECTEFPQDPKLMGPAPASHAAISMGLCGNSGKLRTLQLAQESCETGSILD